MAKRNYYERVIDELRENIIRLYDERRKANREYKNFIKSDELGKNKKRLDELEKEYIDISIKYNEIKEQWNNAKSDLMYSCRKEGQLSCKRVYVDNEYDRVNAKLTYLEKKYEGGRK